jgi:hypothetical protein
MTDATPPVTAPEATPAPVANTDTWYSSIQDTDLKAYTENKGWKNPQDAIVGYKNLESKLGTAINLPSEKATPEEINAFYAKLGRPESPDAYQLPVPEGQDGSFAQNMAKVMFDSGIPSKSAQALASAWNDYQAQQAQAHNEQQAQAEQTQIATLKSEWGAKYDTNEAIAKNAAKAFGVTGDQIDQLQKVMGFDGAMKFFAGLGSKIGEDKFISGNTNGTLATMPMTKEQASQELVRLTADKEFYAKYRANDPEAKAMMDNVWKYMT